MPILNIQPRNFDAAVFKCRSTPTGTLPTDEDLYNSGGRGFVMSNMPSWISLTGQPRADLLAFLKTFSPPFKPEKQGDPIKLPPQTKGPVKPIKHAQQPSQTSTSVTPQH